MLRKVARQVSVRHGKLRRRHDHAVPAILFPVVPKPIDDTDLILFPPGWAGTAEPQPADLVAGYSGLPPNSRRRLQGRYA